MRLLRHSVLVAVLVGVVVTPARAAGPAGTRGRLVFVGPGVSETAQRQVVRSRDGVVFIASVDDDAYSGGAYADLHMYRGNHAGVPAAFTSVDARHDPYVRNPLDISGGDARIDAGGTIHLVYAVSNLTNDDVGSYRENTMTVRYQTFDTGSGRWGAAQTITRLPADGDGVRGRVVTALALDPAGKPLVVTASSVGVSGWRPARGGGWARRAIAGSAAVHPSLAFDPTGRAHLAWLSSPYGNAAIRYATRTPGGRWSAAEAVADGAVLGNDTNDQGPSLGYDASWRPVVLWLDSDDHVRVATRTAARNWMREDPPATFAHGPAVYLRGDERFAILGHDADTHPAYLSRGTQGWSSSAAFGQPAGEGGFYSYDGSASPRFDPLEEPDCRVIDIAFFSEYSYRPGRTGKPDLYYGAVRLPRPAGGCDPARTALRKAVRSGARTLRVTGLAGLLHHGTLRLRRVQALAPGRLRLRLRAHRTIVAEGARRVARAGRYAITARVTAKGRARLRGRARAVVRLTLTLRTGGRTVSASRRVAVP